MQHKTAKKASGKQVKKVVASKPVKKAVSKSAKRCCQHCQDYKYCKEKDGCCEYCDYYIKNCCTYLQKSKHKTVNQQVVLDTSTSYAFDDFRGDNYGIDDYEEYEGYE
jgi:hypothetical protein